MANKKLSIAQRLKNAEKLVARLSLKQQAESDPRMKQMQDLLTELEKAYLAAKLVYHGENNPEIRLKKAEARFQAAIAGVEYHRRNRDTLKMQIDYMLERIKNLQVEDMMEVIRNLPNDPLLAHYRDLFEKAESEWRSYITPKENRTTSKETKPVKAGRSKNPTDRVIAGLRKEHPQADWTYDQAGRQWVGKTAGGTDLIVQQAPVRKKKLPQLQEV
ncbi:MAG: hypothetical protein E6R03_13425 [Hyphomicrobiaceae bacterium]|nr:MAG: hypothetical protein E6R03_13425 [Hyphomicrobiaceae bacterium]